MIGNSSASSLARPPATGAPRTARGGPADATPPCFGLLARSVSLGGVRGALLDRLAALLALPAGHGRGERHVCCTLRDGRYLVRTGVSTQVCGSRADLLAVLATTVPSLLLDQPGWYQLHAGALAEGDVAHLFLGPSCSGKSSLALEAWLAGQQVIGDDYLLVEAASGDLLGVPKPLKIRLPDLALPERLAALPVDGRVLGRLEGGPGLLLGRNLPRMVPACRRHRIGSVHILRRVGGRRSRKRPASRHEAIAALLEQTFVGAQSSLGVLRPFAAALREQRIHVLEAGEDDLAGALALLLS
jgi:hypothetical protein